MSKRASSRRLPAARPPSQSTRPKRNSQPTRSGGTRRTLLHDVAVFVYARGGRRSGSSAYDLVVSKASGKGAGQSMGTLEATGGKKRAIQQARAVARGYAAAGHRRVDVEDDEANSLGTYYAKSAP